MFSVPCSFRNSFSAFYRFFFAEIIAFSDPRSLGRSSSGADAHLGSVRICQWPLAPIPSSIVSRSLPVQRPLFLLASSLSHNSLRLLAHGHQIRWRGSRVRVLQLYLEVLFISESGKCFIFARKCSLPVVSALFRL